MKNVSRLLPLLSGIVTLSGCNHAPQKNNGQNSQKPNIIYIFADDLGIGDLSCYGATKVSTPNTDRLAGQGVQFTNAYATSATSTPSRFGLLTGMYPWRQENTGIAPGNSELIIDTTCVTMADMLKDAGYATGAVGKWHLGLGPKGGTDFNNPITPNAQSIGFDYEFIIPATVDRVPCVFVENGHVVGLDPNDPITVSYDHKVGDWPTGEENPELVTLKPSQGHNNTIINGIPRIGWMTGGKSALWKDEDIADIITHKAKNFIASHQEEPFFLYMGTQDVHVPRIPHPRFAGKSGLGTRGDVILQLDWTIGEIMHTLDSLHIADNTILIFTSDNGPHEEGGADPTFFGRDGKLRGLKRQCHEGGIRIPFIVRWPGKVKAGQVNDHQLAFYDLMPTFCDVAGVKNYVKKYTNKKKKGTDYFDGISIYPTLTGQEGQKQHDFLYWEFDETDQIGVRMGDWKMVVKRGKPFLYNLAEDIHEDHDVAAEHPEIVKQMKEVIKSQHIPNPNFSVTLPDFD